MILPIYPQFVSVITIFVKFLSKMPNLTIIQFIMQILCYICFSLVNAKTIELLNVESNQKLNILKNTQGANPK